MSSFWIASLQPVLDMKRVGGSKAACCSRAISLLSGKDKPLHNLPCNNVSHFLTALPAQGFIVFIYFWLFCLALRAV